MPSANVAPETIAFAEAWARAIRMVPIRPRKEQLGYSFNHLWRVIKKEVLRQISEGHATSEDIDRAWMLIFGTEMAPAASWTTSGFIRSWRSRRFMPTPATMSPTCRPTS